MLKGVDPRLGPDVLRALSAMGHGDVVVLCDANFPAASVAAGTVTGLPLAMDNLTAAEAAEAVLSVLPLDTFEPDPACRMQVGADPDALPPVQAEVAALLDAPPAPVERFAFYDLARGSFAVIVTGERRFYGCFAFRKGVIPPEAG